MGALGVPAAGKVTLAFGRLPSGKFHYGTDRGWGNGKNVSSMATGTVVSTAVLPDYGKTVTVDHGDLLGEVTRTRYCHLASVSVKVGDPVVAGEKIGVMGSTGSLAEGVHLHSELSLAGVRVDEQPHQKSLLPSGGGSQPISPERHSMTVMYQKTGTTPTLFALAGDSPGIPDANWFETTDLNLANQLAAQIGAPPAFLDAASWDIRKAAYRSSLSVSGGSGSGGLTTVQDAKLMSLVSAPEMGNALTGVVSSTINDLTPKIAAVGAKVDGLGISHT